MKVLHVSFGGGIFDQIHLELLEKGIDSQILTLYKIAHKVERAKIFAPSSLSQKKHHCQEAIENFAQTNIYKIQKELDFSYGYVGYNISRNEQVQSADIIHLNWTTRNWLSIANIGQLLRLQKPVVWTLHDVWALTGGCHVLLNGCDKWEHTCGNCPFIQDGRWKKDISYLIMKRKKHFFKNSNLIIVAPSTWMMNKVQKSPLFANSKIYHIPNTLQDEAAKIYNDTEVESGLSYFKGNEISVLFGTAGAFQRSYKGFHYVKESLYHIRESFPELAEKLVIHTFGSNEAADNIFPGYKVINWGILNGIHLFYLYNLADIYLYPSMADNLPSTVMESLVCGTPVVCFNTGGIADMVKHKENGFVAEQGNIDHFINGILWVLANNQDNILGRHGSKFISENFNRQKVTKEHIQMYKDLLR